MSQVSQAPNRLFIPTLGMLSALVAMAMDMYLPSLPEIAQDLQTDYGHVQQTLSVFLGGIAFSQLLYGPLSDRFGRRSVLLVGVSIFAVVSVFCALATDVNELVSMRLLQSLGAGAGSVVAAAVVRDLFQGPHAARVMSYVLMVMMVVPLVAPIIGGYVLLWFGWRAIFVVLVLLGVLCALAVLVAIPETLPAERRQSLRLSSLFHSYRTILSHKKAMGMNLCAAFSFGCLFAFISGSPYLYIEYFDVEPELYGYLFGCNIVMVLLVSYLNSRLVTRFGGQRLLLVGALVQLVFVLCLVLVSWLKVGGLIGTMIPIIPCIGMIGMISANTTATALSYFPNASGTAAGVLGISRFSAAGIASAAVGIMHDGSNLVMPVVMCVCILISFLSLTCIAKVRSLTPEST